MQLPNESPFPGVPSLATETWIRLFVDAIVGIKVEGGFVGAKIGVNWDGSINSVCAGTGGDD
jgi:hypothetical protein